MAYSTIASLKSAVGGDAKYAQLTSNNGVPDDTVGQAAITEADGIINAYVHKIHATPLVTPGALIAARSARIAAFCLRRNKASASITADEIKMHEMDLAWLSAVAKGEIDLGLEPTPDASDLRVDTSGDRIPEKDVSRERLKGFW